MMFKLKEEWNKNKEKKEISEFKYKFLIWIILILGLSFIGAMFGFVTDVFLNTNFLVWLIPSISIFISWLIFIVLLYFKKKEKITWIV